MSDRLEEIKERGWHWTTQGAEDREWLIAKVEELTRERDELKDESAHRFRLLGKALNKNKNHERREASEITTLKAENAEWVAKSHAWLTASMAQDDEITTLKASLEAWEKKVKWLQKEQDNPPEDNA